MKFTKRVKAILAICLLLATSAIAFTATNTLLPKEAAFADDERVVITVANIEEASLSAGYDVTGPNFIPDGFGNNPTITVHQTSPEIPKRVMQMWNSGERDSFFFLVNDPTLGGIGGGEKAMVCGRQGERQLTEAANGRPAILSLYWKDGDMAYVLTGTVNENLSEETLERIVSSVVKK